MMPLNEISELNADWSSPPDYKLLIECTARIHKAATLRECADIAIEGARRIANVKDVAFSIFEDEGGMRILASASGLPIRLHKTPYEYLKDLVEPVSLRGSEIAERADDHAALLVPIMGREDRVQGSLILFRSNTFTTREICSLKSLALAVSVAMENLASDDSENAPVDGRAEMHAMRLLLTEAEEARAAHTAYLAAISHEIRNPLGVILGLTEIAIEQCEDRPQTHELLAAMQRNGRHLHRILGRVLDVAKIEAGCVDIETSEFDLDDFLKDLEMDFRSSLRQKQELCFTLSKSVDVPRFVRTDPTKLRQILTNLLSNALKFTEVGAIVLEVGLQRTYAEGDPALVFKVYDSGIGIAKEQVGRLFSSFAQAETSTSRRFGGTGLGLMLGRQLARSLGGDLQLSRTELGVGSEFVLTLPIV